MATNFPLPPATATATATADNLFAAVDMGTNSFKLTLVRVDPSSGRFFTLNRLKQHVQLGLDTVTTAAPTTISAVSIRHSIAGLSSFQSYLRSHRLPSSHIRLVATSAVRESSNKSEFVTAVNETLDCCEMEVLSGVEEARLIYLGVLQFFPLYSSRVLAIDIGGGSTEFTVGFEGNVLFAESLRLGHVTLTQEFHDVGEMRAHIGNVLENSGLIEKIKGFRVEVVVGSSGTIKAIEKAVHKGYARDVDENLGAIEEFVEREWKFSRDELKCLVDRLCEEAEMGLEGKVRSVGFFGGRAGNILAGTILLHEIFERLGIETMEVSGYALGEGVITEMLGQVIVGFDLKLNARWRSVVRLASRFNNKKRMKAATACAGIARDIFEGLRKTNEFNDIGHGYDECLMSIDDRDLEYLEAASLLHSIGLYAGKKGYHKQSYHVIMNGNHLHGYTKEETSLIGLLVKHHRKKFPKNVALDVSTIKKFRSLCAILRVSVTLQQFLPTNYQITEFIHSPEGIKLVLSEGEARNQSLDIVQPISTNDINALMETELEYFRMVLKKTLSIVFTPSIS